MEKKKKNKEFKNKKLAKGLFAMLIAAALLLSVVPATVIATNDNVKNTANSDIVTAKTATIKITWNANGGKISGKTTKDTSIKKGSKIKKTSNNTKKSGLHI